MAWQLTGIPVAYQVYMVYGTWYISGIPFACWHLRKQPQYAVNAKLPALPFTDDLRHHKRDTMPQVPEILRAVFSTMPGAAMTVTPFAAAAAACCPLITATTGGRRFCCCQ